MVQIAAVGANRSTGLRSVYGVQRRILIKCLCPLGLSAIIIFQFYAAFLWSSTISNSRSCLDTFGNNFVTQQQQRQRVDICFVTSIFGTSVEEVDQPANVEWFAQHWCPEARFFLVTNLDNLSAPGWTKFIQHSTTDKKFIVQSREAKFLAWNVIPFIEQNNCKIVMYMDGYLQPKISWYDHHFSWISNNIQTQPKRKLPTKFQNIVQKVQQHSYGLGQVKQKYFNGLTMSTILNNLVRDRKDTSEHVNTTIQWFQQQSDYQDIMTYYLNKYLAYDPQNENYRELSLWFWNQYTTYGGTYRDQPLWSYTIHHFNCTPAILTTRGTITKGGDLFEKGGTMGWDQHVYIS